MKRIIVCILALGVLSILAWFETRLVLAHAEKEEIAASPTLLMTENPVIDSVVSEKIEEKKASDWQKEPEIKFRKYQVTTRKIQYYIDAPGVVQADIRGCARVLTPLSGLVEKILVDVGDTVKKGFPLVELRCSDVSDIHSSELFVQSQVNQTERVLQLNKKLFEIGAVTKNDLLNCEANFEQAKAQLAGLQRKLEIFGTKGGKGLQDSIVLRAPIDGKVAEIQAHVGDRFDTATSLLTVVNPEKIVIVANIFDTDLSNVKKGQPVVFQTDVFPSLTFNGVISYMSDIEDTDSKTVKTYIKVASGTDLLRQNMFLHMRILDLERDVPVIPKTAMLFKDGKFYVKVPKADGLELKEIHPSKDFSEKSIAVEGINPGELIVQSVMETEAP
ncbi:MAG: efflux RND transporter periplasmic adaptor subunit [Candidatus Riflebacteria bacterium]|nr:efflux RND transporter periplasmic adaptor subunit [Candidatus Riflebacteria bacterium]